MSLHIELKTKWAAYIFSLHRWLNMPTDANWEILEQKRVVIDTDEVTASMFRLLSIVKKNIEYKEEREVYRIIEQLNTDGYFFFFEFKDADSAAGDKNKRKKEKD